MLPKRFDGTERRRHLGQLPVLDKLPHMLAAPLLDQASRRARQQTSDQPTVADPHQRLVVRELEPEGIGVSVLCPGLVAANLTATSSRNRPDRFGGPMTNARGAPMNPAAMANEDVGPIVARAIAANRAVIFTHDDPRGMLADRFAAYEADQHFLGSS